MLLTAILTLSLLAVLNYYVNDRSLFHPAVVFCGIWAFDLFVILAVGGFFFPLSSQSLLIFSFGALAFSIGAHFAKAVPAEPKKPAEAKGTTKLLWLIVLAFPFFIRWILQLAGENADSPLLMALRVATVDLEGGSIALTIFGMLTQIAAIVVLIAYSEKEGHKLRAWIAIVFSLAMAVLTGTKGAPLEIIMGMMYIHWLKTRKIRWKMVATVCVVFALVFTVIEYTVHQADNTEQIAENAALYISGGIVAVDRVISNPHLVPLANPVYDITMRVLKRLGWHTEVVSAHGYQFVDIGPNGLMNNTYTVYGSWINTGPFGMISAMLLIGFIAGLAYHRALRHGKVSAIFYAVYFPAIFFSPFSDLTTTFIWLSLVMLVAWFVYYFPLRLARFKDLLSDIVRADLAKPQLHR
jgi:oligosaccharide repeat unit polymerase